MKRLLNCVLACVLLLSANLSHLSAEYDFEGREDYYYELCSQSDLSSSDTKMCKAFMEYEAKKQNDLQEEIDRINDQMDELKKDIANQVKIVKQLQEEAATIGAEITVLNTEIDALKVQIADLEVQIAENTAREEELSQRVTDRMVSTQRTMRMNQFIDFIMGAKSFEELLRRVTGFETLVEYDESVREELKQIRIQLDADKLALEETKSKLDDSKAILEEKQKEVLLKKYKADAILKAWQDEFAQLEAEGNQISGDLDLLKDKIAEIGDAINEIPPTAGWTKPIASGARYTAGTWAYPQGGIHLGMDLAAGAGTAIRAAGNGIVITSVNGCPTYSSGLGDMCGSQYGGTAGGGNQIYMLTKIDGVLYAVKYLHLAKDTVVPVGTQVSAGDKIAEIGSSGNSSGRHVHVEIFRLGTMSIQSYLRSWNGNLSFGCGYSSKGLSTRCSVKGSAPCRERPEEFFGY
ncbi:MAG: peptidoglycan DD-metalloendopeptidase family protein [Erysipelotrichaceae bacterium]|nr:peptidoglycan DD-metalloendopeptidase family protein [Erysipelotrichaceae bacterium]